MSNFGKLTTRQLRSFGFILTIGFAVIGLWPIVFRTGNPRGWALAVSSAILALSFVFPPALRPIYRVWMRIGEVLGWLNTRIILTVVYYGLIVPIGAFQRMTGSGSMHLKLDPNEKTYRILRTKRPASHIQRQY